jgi:hypothetical protein
MASSYGYLEVVRLLLEKGAKIQAKIKMSAVRAVYHGESTGNRKHHICERSLHPSTFLIVFR